MDTTPAVSQSPSPPETKRVSWPVYVALAVAVAWGSATAILLLPYREPLLGMDESSYRRSIIFHALLAGCFAYGLTRLIARSRPPQPFYLVISGFLLLHVSVDTWFGLEPVIVRLTNDGSAPASVVLRVSSSPTRQVALSIPSGNTVTYRAALYSGYLTGRLDSKVPLQVESGERQLRVDSTELADHGVRLTDTTLTLARLDKRSP